MSLLTLVQPNILHTGSSGAMHENMSQSVIWHNLSSFSCKLNPLPVLVHLLTTSVVLLVQCMRICHNLSSFSCELNPLPVLVHLLTTSVVLLVQCMRICHNLSSDTICHHLVVSSIHCQCWCTSWRRQQYWWCNAWEYVTICHLTQSVTICHHLVVSSIHCRCWCTSWRR